MCGYKRKRNVDVELSTMPDRNIIGQTNSSAGRSPNSPPIDSKPVEKIMRLLYPKLDTGTRTCWTAMRLFNNTAWFNNKHYIAFCVFYHYYTSCFPKITWDITRRLHRSLQAIRRKKYSDMDKSHHISYEPLLNYYSRITMEYFSTNIILQNF